MAAAKLKIDFFIIGATARDIFFSEIFGIKTIRASIDCDLAIRVRSWQEYESLLKELLKDNRFQKEEKTFHRFLFQKNTYLDIIPFGAIANHSNKIQWPPDFRIIMSVMGFEEAYRASITIRLSDKSFGEVKICSPAGLAVMKIISWSNSYPIRNQDAKDLL